MTKTGAEEPNVPRKMRERYAAITEITDEFCHERLNNEYADLFSEDGRYPEQKETVATRKRACEILGRRYRLRARPGELPL